MTHQYMVNITTHAFPSYKHISVAFCMTEAAEGCLLTRIKSNAALVDILMDNLRLPAELQPFISCWAKVHIYKCMSK